MFFFIIAGISMLIVYFQEQYKIRKVANYEEVTGMVTYVFYENIFDHMHFNPLTLSGSPFDAAVEKTGIHENKHAVTVIYTYNGVEYRKTFSRPYRINHSRRYRQYYRNPYRERCLTRYSEGQIVHLLVDPINQEVYFKEDIIIPENTNNKWMLIGGIIFVIFGLIIGTLSFF